MRVRIIGIPREKQSPDVRTNPFVSPYADQMKYGGRLEDDTAHGNQRLDTKWDWMRQPDKAYGYDPGPYTTSSRILPEAKPGAQNVINAEKQEQTQKNPNKSWVISMVMECLY